MFQAEIDVVCETEGNDPTVGIFGFTHRAFAKNIDDDAVCTYYLSEPNFRWDGTPPKYAKIIERTLEAYVNALLEYDIPDTDPPPTLDDPNK